jgi:hypothetical protein
MLQKLEDIKKGSWVTDKNGNLFQLIECTTIMDGYEDRFGNEYVETKRIARVRRASDGHAMRFRPHIAIWIALDENNE